MKKNFKCFAFIAAVLATATLSSCSNDDNNDVTDATGKSVFLKVAGGVATRADEASQIGATTAISTTLGGDVFFVSGTGAGATVVDHAAIVPVIGAPVGAVTATTLLAGHAFQGIAGTATSVYIVVNKPAGVTLPTTGLLSTIKAVAMNITDFTAINAVCMQGDGTILTGTPNTAAVVVAPVVARFEIAKVEYDAAASSSVGNPVTSFELAGIFVNNHHKTMGLDGTPIAGQLYASQTATDYAVANFPAPLADIFVGKTGATSYLPTAVWAYQIFPINSTDAVNDQPMLVVKLTNVADGLNSYTADQYISVNKFVDAANTSTYITKFEANKIYKIASIKFSNRNLSTIPGTTLQDVTVTVTVTPWTDMTIVPEL